MIEQKLSEGHPIQIAPEGYSMYPFIVPGRDEVVVSPLADEKELKKGTIVLFRDKNSERLILHRIHHAEGDYFYEWGDNSLTVNGPHKKSCIIGVMTAVVKRGREVSVDRLSCRLYTFLWPHVQPLRRFLSKLIRQS